MIPQHNALHSPVTIHGPDTAKLAVSVIPKPRNNDARRLLPGQKPAFHQLLLFGSVLILIWLNGHCTRRESLPPRPFTQLLSGKTQHLPLQQTHRYLIPLNAGDLLEIRLLQDRLDIAAKLKHIDGKTEIAADRATGTRGSEFLLFQVSGDGNYYLELNTLALAHPGGQYEPRVRIHSAARPLWQARTRLYQFCNKPLERPVKAEDYESLKAQLLRFQALAENTSPHWVEAICQERLATMAQAIATDREQSPQKRASAQANQQAALSGAVRVFQANGMNADAAVLSEKLAVLQHSLNPLQGNQTLDQAIATLGVGQPAVLGRLWRRKGQIFAQRGAIQNAMAAYSKAVQESEKARDWEGIAQSLEEQGIIYGKLKQTKQARTAYRQAANYWQKLGQSNRQQRIAIETAWTFHLQGDQPEAIDRLRLITSRADPTMEITALSGAYDRLGSAFRDSRVPRYEDALQAYKKSRKLLGNTHPHLLVHHFINTAQLYLEWQKPAQARDSLAAAERLSGSWFDPAQEAHLLFLKAWAHILENDLQKAVTLIDQNINILSQLRSEIPSANLGRAFLDARYLYLEKYMALLFALHQQHPSQGFARRALLLCESFRGFHLRLLLQDRFAAKHFEVSQNLENRWRTLLNPETVALVYFLAQDRSYVWALTQQNLHFKALPPGKEIAKAAKQFIFQLRTSYSQEDPLWHAGAQRLGETLLAPIAQQVEGKNILVVADNKILHMPFDALFLPGEDEPLVAGHQIITLPSLTIGTMLRQVSMQADARSKAEILVIGGCKYEAEGRSQNAAYPDLAYSAAEARDVAAYFPKHQAVLKTGSTAALPQLQGLDFTRFQYLHFAVHAAYNSADPAKSCLIFSQYDGKNRPQTESFWYLETIEKQNFNAELSVLSACQTALGNYARGEGDWGLDEVFLARGARRVLASLWLVDDRATHQLMRKFYHNLRQRHLPPGEALQQAKNHLRAHPQYQSPFFWAAFQLQGDPSPLPAPGSLPPPVK